MGDHSSCLTKPQAWLKSSRRSGRRAVCVGKCLIWHTMSQNWRTYLGGEDIEERKVEGEFGPLHRSSGDNDTNNVHYTSAITNNRITHSYLPCSLVGWIRHSMGSGVCSQGLFSAGGPWYPRKPPEARFLMVMFPSLRFVTVHLYRGRSDSEMEAVQDQECAHLELLVRHDRKNED